MAGAAGDALGYEVEFMSRRAILSRFGENGITKFALDCNGKALISDDTQMTLSTGCIISEYDSIDTPEKRQWFDRYCEMKPAGIGVR